VEQERQLHIYKDTVVVLYMWLPVFGMRENYVISVDDECLPSTKTTQFYVILNIENFIHNPTALSHNKTPYTSYTTIQESTEYGETKSII
jgi:hypothetical protein